MELTASTRMDSETATNRMSVDANPHQDAKTEVAKNQEMRNPERSVMEAHALSVVLGGHAILSEIDLAVPAGQVTVLLGPNGAGKSTLLKTFAGLVRPRTGRLLLNGAPLPPHGTPSCARARAVLLQDFHLPFAFTVEEVVMMGRYPHAAQRPGDRESAHDHAVVDSCLHVAGLTALRERLYPTLSGGERQRAHWARVLAQLDADAGLHGKCVLLDEPTSSLDLAHQHALLAAARGLARRGAAVLVVLHDLNLAARYGDALVLLRQGRVLAQGSPAAVLTSSNLRSTYGVDARVVPDPEDARPWVLVRGGDAAAAEPPRSDRETEAPESHETFRA